MLCPVCLAVGENVTAVTTVGGTGFCARHGVEAVFGPQNDGQPIRAQDPRMRFTLPGDPEDVRARIQATTPSVSPPAPVVPTPTAPAPEQPDETPT